MAKQSINMRLDREILDKAGITAIVEMVLRNIINNRKTIDLIRKTASKSKWLD